MKDIVEIRFRIKSDLRDWEEIPALCVEVHKKEFGVDQSAVMTRGKLTALLRKITDWDAVNEIRWNWFGSYQGHYIEKDF